MDDYALNLYFSPEEIVEFLERKRREAEASGDATSLIYEDAISLISNMVEIDEGAISDGYFYN